MIKSISSIEAPLYAYGETMEWAKEAYRAGCKYDTKNSYNATIKCLEQRYNFQVCCPTNIKIKMCQDHAIMNVVLFDAKK